MTVSSTVNTSPIYAGNDTTGPWAFSFKTFDQAELEVIKASSAGVETILTLTTEYTVSLNGDQNASPGGEVTTVANVATGESLRVRWVGIPTQETDIQNAGGFYPEVIENALDKLTMLTQRNTEEIGRAVKTTITSGDDPDALVASLLAAEVNAAASEAAAAVSAGNASTSETNAAASAASINPTTFVKRDGTQGMQGLLQLDYSTDIASAATVDLGTATGNSVTVTHSSGTTVITSFGGAATVQKGGIVAVIPSISGGTLTVTHHATNMILLGGANITLASGDVLLMMKNHDSNAEWKHVGGWKADGTAWVVAASSSVPEGTVSWFAANTAPTGYLKANGAAISRTTYAALFAIIGTTYGVGDGATTFNVPDLRGEFIRGWDDGRGIDSARVIGSSQASANLSHSHGSVSGAGGAHSHTLPASSGVGTGGVPRNEYASGTFSTSTSATHTHSIASDGDAEARPRNVAMLACIKY